MPVRRGNARALFGEGAFAEDTTRSGRAGAKILREARSQFEREGVEVNSNARTVYEIADRRLHGLAS
ncbi:MAG TPA: hypothetical protein VFY04_08245 [Solirubrobacterales bacterium]|nr:hypothetical protein [Solirubrobacterales bacterium]